MRFENAYKGIKKIFTAEILSLIASLTGVGAVANAIVGYAADQTNHPEIIEKVIGIFAALGIVTMGLMLIAFIIQIIGLSQAGKDEPVFRRAIFEILLAVAATAVKTFINDDGSLISQICDGISDVIVVVVMLEVTGGISNLAEKLGNQEMVARGKTMVVLLLVSFTLQIILQVLQTLVYSDPRANMYVILAGISLVIEIVKYILYLIYLAKAKKMLAAS